MLENTFSLWQAIAVGAIPVVLAAVISSYPFRRKFFWLNNCWCYITEKLFNASCGSDGEQSILIANFSGDKDGTSKEHVRNALRAAKHDFELLTTERLLRMDQNLNFENGLSKAHKKGRIWLEDRKADLLIWGEAYSDKNLFRLKFTTLRPQCDAGGTYQLDEKLELPKDFSTDIHKALVAVEVVIAAEEKAAKRKSEKSMFDNLFSTSIFDDNITENLQSSLASAYSSVGDYMKQLLPSKKK